MSEVSLSIAPAQEGQTPTQLPSSEDPDLRQLGMLFRSLLESPRTAREWADSGVAMPQAQTLPNPGHGFEASTRAPAGAADPAVAQLMEWHIRRILASADASCDGEIRIELSDAVFPGTALTLKRTPQGWHLAATADNRLSLDELNRFAPALVERFAKASLGQLQVTLDGG